MTILLWVLTSWAVLSVPASLLIARAIRDRDVHAPTMTVARHLAVVREDRHV